VTSGLFARLICSPARHRRFAYDCYNRTRWLACGHVDACYSIMTSKPYDYLAVVQWLIRRGSGIMIDWAGSRLTLAFGWAV